MRTFLFVFLFFTFPAMAQLKPKQSYPVYVNYSDYSVKTAVLNTSGKINVKQPLTYFWYSSNKIMDTQGGFDGKVLHGFYTSFYLSGNLKEKGAFKKGLKNGTWTSWYENGKIKENKHWKNGLQVHTSNSFNDTGALVLQQKFRNGKLHGTQTTYENGKITATHQYKRGMEVINNKKEGTSTINEKGKSNLSNPESVKSKKYNFIKKERAKKVTAEEIKSESPAKIAATSSKPNAFLSKFKALFKKNQPDKIEKKQDIKK